jgi:hypothetical protein
MNIRSTSLCLVASPVFAAALASSVCGQTTISSPSQRAIDSITFSFDGGGGGGGAFGGT